MRQVCVAWCLLEARRSLAAGRAGDQAFLSAAQAAFRGSCSGPSACPPGNTVVGDLV